MSKLRNVRVLVLAGMFIALGIVLRFVGTVYLTPSMAVGLRPIAIMISSITLGPFVGAFVAIFEDLIGAPMRGFAINPFINGIQLVYGILPGLLLPRVLKLTKNNFKFPIYFVVIGLTQFIAGGLLMPLALNIMSGTVGVAGWTGLFITRLPQQAIHMLVYPPVTYFVAMATQSVLHRMPIGRSINAAPTFFRSR